MQAGKSIIANRITSRQNSIFLNILYSRWLSIIIEHHIFGTEFLLAGTICQIGLEAQIDIFILINCKIKTMQLSVDSSL